MTATNKKVITDLNDIIAPSREPRFIKKIRKLLGMHKYRTEGYMYTTNGLYERRRCEYCGKEKLIKNKE